MPERIDLNKDIKKEYEVEQILDKKRVNGGVYYLMK